jgi:hypothetical protein
MTAGLRETTAGPVEMTGELVEIGRESKLWQNDGEKVERDLLRMKNFSRRTFLQLTGTAGGSLIFGRSHAAEGRALPSAGDGISFFLIGDTHYLAEQETPGVLDDVSMAYTSQLIAQLHGLPGTRWPEVLGGGTIPEPRGLIHAGDLIDSGDKNDAAHLAMQSTELTAFLGDFGLNGGDGRLRWSVHEVYGNHDAPQGTGLVVDAMRERNRKRKEVANVSTNGVHHSWDWGGVHFINLGIVVGPAKGVEIHGQYNALDSLDFLVADLAGKVGQSGRPVIITHHVDVARYSVPDGDPARAAKNEWGHGDVAAYYEALKGYRVAGIFYGHTHVRRVFPWDGRPPAKPGTTAAPSPGAIPVFNTAKVSHFNSAAQAFFHFQLTDGELIAREFATKDGWKTAAWTPELWRFALPA